MISLYTLCEDIIPLDRLVVDNADITGIAVDSRKIKRGNLFIAVDGFETDGHAYITDAVGKGAAAVILQNAVDDVPVPVLRVTDSRQVMGELARRFYNDPSRDMTLIGVTGTNGKTTVTHILETILLSAGLETGIIGTLAYRWKDRERKAERTTPDSIDMQRLLSQMKGDGVTHVAMEVSSHALALNRVSGMRFRAGVFTNLSRDHLDFHASYREYGEIKARLFGLLGTDSIGVVNGDDPASQQMREASSGKVVSYGRIESADYQITDIELLPDRSRFSLSVKEKTVDFSTPLLGLFNVMNCAAAAGCAIEIGLDREAVRRGIDRVGQVRGRMEVLDSNKGFRVVVDYAHTPGALQTILNAVRDFTSGRVIVVFGCGGDRDRGKRPEMGNIAEKLADLSVITTDNPRNENPEKIIADIMKGVHDKKSAAVIPDRKKAIVFALNHARTGDTVIVAGKGHETYQETGGKRFSFDDRQVVENHLGLRGE